MICYATPSMPERFMLTDDVLGHFVRHQQVHFWQREAGGQLFARFEPGNTLIERATGPRPGDRRSRYSYRPNPEAEQREIYAMHAIGLHYVGDWHTHPEPVPHPSSIDNLSMADCVAKSQHALPGFLLTIVGTASLPEGLHVSLIQAHASVELALERPPIHATRPAWGVNGVLSGRTGDR